MAHGPAHSMACSPTLHSRVSFSSSVIVSEAVCESGMVATTQPRADAQWLITGARVYIWLV